MALITKKEFTKVTGIESKHLSTYQKRGKIILQGDYIDMAIPQNADFMQQRIEKNGTKKIEVPSLTPNALPNRETTGSTSPGSTKIYELDTIIKQLQADKLEKENHLKDIEIAKREGRSIPVQDVELLFGQTFKAVTVEFHQAIDDFTAILGKQFGADATTRIEVKERYGEVLNQAIEAAKETAAHSVKMIINEHRETRGRGQKK